MLDHTSPIYEIANVYDETPSTITIDFEELSVTKICNDTCGAPNSKDFTVKVDDTIIPFYEIVASINSGRINLQLLNYRITYQQKVYLSYMPSSDMTSDGIERRFRDIYGNEAKYFSNKLILNHVFPAPRIALVSDLKHSVLQIYFTGSGANVGDLHVDDWTVWYEKDQRGLNFPGYCTDLKNNVSNTTTVWTDDAGETCETFQKSKCVSYGCGKFKILINTCLFSFAFPFFRPSQKHNIYRNKRIVNNLVL